MTIAPEARAIDNPIDRALSLIDADVAQFDELLLRTLEPQRPYLTEAEYAIYQRGKKLRPMLLLLAARLSGRQSLADPLPERVLKAAVSLEMLHVATLIHDDIVDAAPKRRGVVSINAARGTDVALLIGDMQFVQAVRCFAAGIEVKEDLALVLLVLDVGFKICCGELDELATDPGWTPKKLRSRYLRTIDRKTAVLFELACESGAALVRARKRAIWKLGRYGRLVGRAFQVMDDLADFVTPDEEAGKLRGMDLIRRRVTLPIINAMEELPEDSLVHRAMRGEALTASELAKATDLVVCSAGFLRAYADARRYVIEAVECLDFFPDSPLRDVLRDIAYFVVNRGPVSVDSGLAVS